MKNTILIILALTVAFFAGVQVKRHNTTIDCYHIMEHELIQLERLPTRDGFLLQRSNEEKKLNEQVYCTTY